MSQPPLNNPGARYWDDLMEEFDFSPDEKREIRQGADHVIAEVRARRLAEVRKRQNATQVEVAAAMGVSQARISRIEKGQLEKSEVETLAAYVKALGGKLKIIADLETISTLACCFWLLCMRQPKGTLFADCHGSNGL